jgi:hypothetical protein
MAIETWIDDLCAVWDEVSDGKGGFVKSYRVYTKAEFPEAITMVPCVLSYTKLMQPKHASGFQICMWKGASEFHLSESVAKQWMPDVMRYFARILSAAAAHVTLGGKVSFFIVDFENGVQGPVVLQYGSEEPHWGIMVNWMVEENVILTIGG